MITISVIIPTYGRAEFLDYAIISVLNQTYPHIEIVVVDDNNPNTIERENTEQCMKKYRKDGRIKYIRLAKNSGGASARNRGVLESTGEYIAFLDDDDMLLSNYLETMFAECQSTGYNVTYEASYYFMTPNYSFESRNSPQYVSGDICSRTISGDILISILLLIHKKSFLECGMFDENIRGYDDYDLWMRLTQREEFGCITETLAVVRRYFGEHLTGNPEKLQADLNVIIAKWSPLMSQKKVLFDRFILEHNKKIDYLRIYYKKEMNCEIKKFRRELIKKYNLSTKEQMRLWINTTFGTYEDEVVNKIKMSFLRKRYKTISVEEVIGRSVINN